jgi:hypothetical protein
VPSSPRTERTWPLLVFAAGPGGTACIVGRGTAHGKSRDKPVIHRHSGTTRIRPPIAPPAARFAARPHRSAARPYRPSAPHHSAVRAHRPIRPSTAPLSRPNAAPSCRRSGTIPPSRPPPRFLSAARPASAAEPSRQPSAPPDSPEHRTAQPPERRTVPPPHHPWGLPDWQALSLFRRNVPRPHRPRKGHPPPPFRAPNPGLTMIIFTDDGPSGGAAAPPEPPRGTPIRFVTTIRYISRR